MVRLLKRSQDGYVKRLKAQNQIFSNLYADSEAKMWNDPSWPQTARNILKCTVCEQGISSSSDLSDAAEAVCSSIHCRQAWQKKSTMPPAMFQHYLNFQRQVIQERLVREKQEEDHRVAVDDKIRSDNLVLFDRILKQYGDLLPETASPDTHLIALPSGSRKVSPVTAGQLAEYRAHLQKMIIGAMVTNDADDVFLIENEEKAFRTDNKLERQPELAAKSGRFCGLCKGGCCTAGGNDALLDVRGIRRYMLSHTHLSPLEIMESYLAKVPDHAVEDSCINHTATGCALPREMRSDICNGYFCDPVKAHNSQLQDSPKDSVVAIVRGYRNFRKYHEGADLNVREVAILDDRNLELIPAVQL